MLKRAHSERRDAGMGNDVVLDQDEVIGVSYGWWSEAFVLVAVLLA